MANRLGGVIRYLNDAWTFGTRTPIQPRNFAVALSALAEHTRHRGPHAASLDQALRLAITTTWVYAGVRLIATRASSSEARMIVKRRMGEKLEDVRNHAFERLLDRPNPLMTYEYISAYTSFWTFLSGNAYLFIATVAPGMGEPEEIWPLPASMVTPLPETLRTSKMGGQCIDYAYTIGEKVFRLPGENMVHVRMPNMFDYWNGMSPLTPMMQTVRIDRAQKNYVESFYTDDNAVPPAIISLPSDMSVEDFHIAKEQIRYDFGGKKRTAITRAGDLKVQMINQTMDQLQMISMRDANRDEIFALLGIPNGMISEGLSGDSRLGAEIAFTRSTVQPYLNALAAEFTANVAPYYGENVVIAAPSIVPQDRSLRIQEFSTYAQDRTPNENREWLSLAPISPVDVLAAINTKRSKDDKEPLEFADGVLELMMGMPTRLHGFISSNTFKMAQPDDLYGADPYADPDDPYADADDDGGAAEEEEEGPDLSYQQPAPPGVGAALGVQGPEAEARANAMRSVAARIGMETELKRWRSVALRGIKHHNNAGALVFVSDAIEQPLHTMLVTQLQGVTDETHVRAVFDHALHTLVDADRA